MSHSSNINMQTDETPKRSEAELVREYIVCCPHVRKNNPLLQAALYGLEKEVKRMERDKKLKSKFVANSAAASAGKPTNPSHAPLMPTPTATQPVGTMASYSKQETVAADDDWQEINTPAPDSISTYLANRAVAGLSSGEVQVKTPFGAIFVILHALLVSEDTLGFTSLGVPAQGKKSKGFAAAIRDTDKSKYFPANWKEEQSQNMVSCRYRRADTGSVTLHLFFNEHENEVQVDFSRDNSCEAKHMSFPIKQHMNLSSFEAALGREGKVKPSLHYKSLPQLMNDVITKFNISIAGDVSGASSGLNTISGSKRGFQQSLPYVDATAAAMAAAAAASTTFMPALTTPAPAIPVGYPSNLHAPPTLQLFAPGHLNRPGDFAGDLRPPGLAGAAPSFMGQPSGAGNLMGPGHPMFTGGGHFTGSGYGMQPRFDHFGPPGGPQDPRNLQPGNPPRPGRIGEPNPDHQRVPNNLSNNMFT